MSKISVSKRVMLKMAAIMVAAPAFAQQLKPITIAISSTSIPAGAARIAKELGLFEKHGLNARVVPMDTGAVASAALMGGSADFVTTGPSDVVTAQAQGLKLVAITTGYRGFAATLVLSNATVQKLGVSPTAPVAERLKALNGLTIATTSASSTFAVGPKSAIEGAGARVTFTYMAQPAMIAALKTGAVAGYIASAPFYLAPVLDGSGVIWIQGAKGDWPTASAPVNSVVVMTKKDYADANPEVIRQVRAVFADVWKAVAERPAEVKAAMGKIWPDVEAKTMDMLFNSEAPGFIAKPVTADDMAKEIAFMKLGLPNLATENLKPTDMVLP